MMRSWSSLLHLFGTKTKILALVLMLAGSALYPAIARAVDVAPTIDTQNLFSARSLLPRVDGGTGALTESVKLEIPPGRNDLAPEISLEYNSQNLVDGIVGYGWSLSIPYIERLNKTGSEKLYTDGYFVSSLGGELATTTTANEYRQRIEDGRFIKYTFSNNVWTAYDKGGTRYLFGTTTQAQQSATTSPSNVYRWMLEEVRDKNDNFIRYEYNKDFNQIYPYKIYYTGSGSTDGPFTIQFSTSTRSDIPISHKSGFRVNTRYRISEIKAYVDSSWVRKYTLSYANGVNGVRSLLSSVQQTGRDELGTELALPATTFGYSSSTPAYTTDNNLPQIVNAARIAADVDGNALPEYSVFGNLVKKNEYPAFNNNTVSAPDTWAVSDNPVERGVRFFDVNGDGQADVVKGVKYGDGSYSRAYHQKNNGSYTWASTTVATGTIPAFSVEVNSSDKYSTGLLGNINGDGLIDYVLSMQAVGGGIENDNGTYLHVATSSGWSLATSTFTPMSTMPISATTGAISSLVDINGDNLDDWMDSGSGSITFRLNTGTGWEATYDNGWYISTSTRHANGWDRGIRFIDVNGDELPDYVRGYHMPSYSTKCGGYTDVEIGTYDYVYLNTGSGFAAATSSFALPTHIFNGELDGSNRWCGGITYNEPVDWNGDGILDLYNYVSTTTKPDVLAQTTYPTGGTTEAKHKYTSQLASDNPDLAFPLLVVTEKTTRDYVADPQVTSYRYEGGKTYLSGDIRDRRFAGFKTVTKTDALGVTKTYFNQGDSVDTATGEQTDDFAQIGKPYRELITTLASSTMKDTYFKWTTVDQGATGPRKYAYLEKEMTMQYDGDSDHRDVAVEYTYATTTGDLTQVVSKGEVTGSTNGTYSDVSGDTTTKDITYAGNTDINLRVPIQEAITNNGGTQVKLSKLYYDNDVYGSVTTGNLTKQENWISGSTYASSTKAYNSYGLVTSETDPRSKTTSYQYDTRNLYVATSTNPLSHVTGFSYDYASGKTKLKIDPNNRTWQWVYDPVGRVTEKKGPDPSSGSLTMMASTTYTDSVFPRKQQETRLLSSATSTDIYTYLDGLGRAIQERTESSTSYSVKDKVYGNHGLLQKESVPYFSSGSANTSATTSSTALTTYTYDALRRIATTTNVLGSETHAFDQWKETVTDRRGKPKDLISDAHGNLANVIEYSNSSPATTTYSYDPLGNLTKITDALGNIRNFFYDGLSRATSTEDLHASGDSTFGTWTHTYDLASNVTQTVDPKSQTVDKTYDAINRILTEDYTGSGGTEVTYEYDTCTDGTGRLCIATTTAAVTTYAYNPLGLPSSETKKIDNVNYTTSYTYDRLGNTVTMTYPNSSMVRYDHDSAGLLDGIYQKESGGSYVAVVDNINYGPTGAITLKSFSNGVDSTYTYDSEALYRLTNILTQAGGVGGMGDASLFDISEDLLFQLRNAGEYRLAQASFEEEELPSGASTTTEEGSEVVVDTELMTDAVASTASSTEVTVIASPPTENAPSVALTNLPTVPSTNIHKIIAGKSAKERASVKGQEMAKIGSISRAARAEYDIEVESMEGIDDGVQVFARAWDKNGQPVGFGVDGSVETERFRIVNPPILVKDPSGDIEIKTVIALKEGTFVKVIKYRENLQEALLQILEDTIQIVGKGGANIVKGKVGNTTTTVYPSHDRTFQDTNNYPTGGAYSVIHDNTASDSMDSGSATVGVQIRGGNVNGNWDNITRSGFTFDTSSITDTDTIDGVTFGIVGGNGLTKEETVSGQSVSIVGFTPANETSYATGDYDQFGTTRYADTDKTIASWNTDGATYNSWTFNTSGKNAISKTGNTVIGARMRSDVDNSAPTWASNSNGAYAGFTMSAAAGTTDDPKLTVEHSAGGGGGPATTTLQNMSYTYDAVGNITNIADTSDTAANKTVVYTYDDLSRLLTASTTAATSSQNFYQRFTYDALGNITSNPLGAYSYGGSSGTNYANPHALTAIASTTGATITNIAYDNSTISGAGGSSLTFSHTTNSNTNGLIVVGVYASAPDVCSPDPITGVTYNGVSLTDLGYYVGTNSPIGGAIKTYYGFAPATGAHNVVVSASGTCIGYAVAVTYTGVKQSGMPDASGTGNPLANSGAVEDLSRTVVTAVDNAWLFMCGVPGSGGTATADSGTTMRQQLSGAIYCADAGPKATAGSNTIGWTKSSASWVANFFSFAPIAPTGGSTATTTYAYDSNGNLTSVISSATTTLYTYDYANRLTQTAIGAGGSTTTTTYAYDHAGQRVRMTSPATTRQATSTTIYPSRFYSVSTTTTSNSTTTKFIFGGDTLFANIEGNGSATTTYYMHPDHLGSTNVVTNASGTAVQTLDYYPYGTTRIDAGTDVSEREFLGERFDESTSLSYLNARYLDSQRGQFLSQDPVFHRLPISHLLDPQLQNSYGYARDNPIIYKDATGEIPVLVVTAGAGALIGGVSGIVAQAIADRATGNDFKLSNYAGAFAGGAVQGGLIGSGVGLFASGGAGGLAQGVTREGIDAYNGEGFSYESVAGDTAANAILGPVGGKIASKLGVPGIAGVTTGSNSMSAIAKSTATKMSNGTIGSFSPSTGLKIGTSYIVGGTYGTLVGTGFNTAYNVIGGGGSPNFNSAASSVSAAGQALSRGDFKGASQHLGNAVKALGGK